MSNPKTFRLADILPPDQANRQATAPAVVRISDFAPADFEQEEVTDVFHTGAPSGGAPGEAERHYLITVLVGPQTGLVRMLGNEELVLGRGQGCGLQLDDSALSRRHCRITREGDGYFIEDLGSSNGTFVDGVLVHGRQPLSEGANVHLGRQTVFKFSRQDQLERNAARQLYESSMRDGLTGMHNRRYLDQRLREEVAFASRHGSLLSLLLLDVDHFKKVNDTYGHPAGDAVLKQLAGLVERSVRKEDVAARFGGEEFAVLLRGIGAPGARTLAERIRKRVEDTPIYHGDQILLVTTSIGLVAAHPARPFDNPSALLAAADAALYRAKHGGRNRCEEG